MTEDEEFNARWDRFVGKPKKEQSVSPLEVTVSAFAIGVLMVVAVGVGRVVKRLRGGR